MSTRPDLGTDEWQALRERELGGHVLACYLARPRTCAGVGRHRLPPCRYCGRPADTLDHVVPVALGGAPLDPGNVVPACGSCNSSKGARFAGTDRYANVQFAARCFVRRHGWDAGSTPDQLHTNVSMAVGFMDETWSRNLLNLMVTPLREIEFLAGLVVMSAARLLGGLSVVALAAFGLYSFNVTTAGWGLIPVVAVLMLVGWSISLFVMALVLRFGNGAEILCWGLLFMVVALSGAFYPIEAMPGALQPLAGLLPSTHAFEAARRLLDGDPMPWDLIGRSVAGLAIILPVSMWTLWRMLGLFRARGYVTRYS